MRTAKQWSSSWSKRSWCTKMGRSKYITCCPLKNNLLRPTKKKGTPGEFYVLRLKHLNWPALHIQSNDPLRIPVHPIGHQHDIRARQLRAFETHHQPHFAQSGQPHSQGKRPVDT